MASPANLKVQKILKLAADLRERPVAQAQTVHIEYFNTEVLRIIEMLKTKQVPFSETLIREAEEHIANRQVTYLWTHIFLHRAVAAMMESKTHKMPIGDGRAYENLLFSSNGGELKEKCGAFLCGQVLRDLLRSFPKVILIPSVDTTKGEGAFWDIETFVALEGQRIYPTALAMGDNYIDSNFAGNWFSYVHDLLHARDAENALRWWRERNFSRWFTNKSLDGPKFWLEFDLMLKSRLQEANDVGALGSSKYFYYFVKHEGQRSWTALTSLRRSKRYSALVHLQNNMVKRLMNVKDQNKELPENLREAGELEVRKWVELGQKAFVTAMDQMVKDWLTPLR